MLPDAAEPLVLALAVLGIAGGAVAESRRRRAVASAAGATAALAAMSRGAAAVNGFVERWAADGSQAEEIANAVPASLAALGTGDVLDASLHRLVEPASIVTLAERDGHVRRREPSDVTLRLADGDGWTRTVREVLVPEDDGRTFLRVVVDVTAPDSARVGLERALAEATEARVVAERERAAARRLAATDVVTGAANRASLIAAADVALREARGTTRHVALAFVEIDRFAALAEVVGHVGGDRIVAEVARRIAARLEPAELLGRWDGHQLAVLVPDAPAEATLRVRGAALRDVVSAGPVPGLESRITVSATVAIARVDGASDVETLIADASRALRQARRAASGLALASEALAAGGDGGALQRTAASLAQVLEVREGVPAGHGQRIASLADHIARELDLPEAIVARCRLVGWLHDVGLVAVPDAILRKPAPLGVAELTTLRTHAPVGEQLVRRLPLLAEAAPGVRHHHERWDGLGYPDGIAGTAIPLEARIVAAADAWISMREVRPFRGALGPDHARDELRAASGAQLDPDVVEALLALLERADQHPAGGG